MQSRYQSRSTSSAKHSGFPCGKRRAFTSAKSAHSGFTLIELLVVIAIIAILAAILFPVFAQARDKARAAACLSNTKQLGLAVMQYVQDYDETYPNGTYQYGAIGGWAGQVFPYVKSAGLYRCVSDSLDVTATDKPTSYGMNSNFRVSGNLSGGVPNVSIAMADANAPAKTVLFYEVEGNTNVDVTQYKEGPYSINYNASPFGNGAVDGYSPSGGGTFNACPPPDSSSTLKYATGYMGGRAISTFACHYTGPEGRHAQGSDFLMADGHAKWSRGSQVSSGGNNASETGAQQPWQYGNAAGTSGAFPSGAAPAVTFSIK